MLPAGSAAVFEAIDEAQQRLREILTGRDAERLAVRPPNGKWSVVENVRHLVFAEQAHLDRFFRDERLWSANGLARHTMREQKRLRMVGTDATTDINEVLDAWQAVHAAAREVLTRDSEQVTAALQKNLVHLRHHTGVVEALLHGRSPRSRGLGQSGSMV